MGFRLVEKGTWCTSGAGASTVRISPTGEKAKGRARAVKVSLPMAATKALGWKRGDSIIILKGDGEDVGRILIRISPNGKHGHGYKLYAAGSQSNSLAFSMPFKRMGFRPPEKTVAVPHQANNQQIIIDASAYAEGVGQ